MIDEETIALSQRINELRVEHDDLDAVIARLADDVSMDHLRLQRLKKRKLRLKDQIAILESRRLPNLNA